MCISYFILFLNLILAQSVLIGLVPNPASKYGFEWTDGSLVEDGYMNWAIGEPSVQGNEQCVVIQNNTKRWSDDTCVSNKHYACQRSSGKSLCTKAICLNHCFSRWGLLTPRGLCYFCRVERVFDR